MTTLDYHYTIDTVDFANASIRTKPVLGKYTILNDMGDSDYYGVYRSVVLWMETSKPVAFAPVRAVSLETFLEHYSGSGQDIQMSETIEGTMINLFYGPEGWEIATKSAIGGHYWYYRSQYGDSPIDVKQKTFREMFLEGMRVEPDTALEDVPFIRSLSKEYSYCFVIQHPENHIVLTIDEPRVWLVAMFQITANDDYLTEYRIRQIPQSEFVDLIPDFEAMGVVHLPTSYVFHTDVETMVDKLRKGSEFWSPHFMGYMITNLRTGERCSFENKEYLRLRDLRGNHPNLQYQYLVLLHMGKIPEFLWHFPSYKPLFNRFYAQYNQFITTVHNAYVAYYIQRRKDEIPKKYFVHAARLHHEVYIPSLSSGTGKTIIRRSVVRDYVSKLEPRELMYALNEVAK